jgi:hypothetical protein
MSEWTEQYKSTTSYPDLQSSVQSKDATQLHSEFVQGTMTAGGIPLRHDWAKGMTEEDRGRLADYFKRRADEASKGPTRALSKE